MKVTEKPSHTFSFPSQLHMPLPIINGHSPASSPYVQLSRAKTLARLSILRPFDPAELRSDLSKHLLAELEWQTQKAKET